MSPNRSGQLGAGSVVMFFDTTDAGSDQAARRKQALAALAGCDSDMPGVFYMDSNCLLHQYHLMVKEQLQSIDQALLELARSASENDKDYLFERYFGSIAKTVNFWRENVHEVISSWENIHGSKAPEGINYRAYPLRVVSGRWGSIENAESFMLKRSRQYLQPALLGVLSSRVKANRDQGEDDAPSSRVRSRGRGQGGRNRGPGRPRGRGRGRSRGRGALHDKPTVDELVDDEDSRRAYHFKMSKWASGCYQAVRCSLFWLLLHVMSIIRAPLTHLYCWLQAHSQDRPFLHLVCGKAAAFHSEFEQLMSEFDAWFSKAISDAGANDIPEGLLQKLEAVVQEILTSSAASFHARVVSACNRRL